MGVVNTLSNAITNADASPRVPNSSYIEGGILRASVATVEVAAADSDGSVYRFFRLPSGARIHKMMVFCDAITSGTSFDCGIYQTAANGGAVVDADAYASAVDLSSAITTGTNIQFEARNIDKIEKRVWEDAGLSADSYREYDICLTANTVGSAAGTISMLLEYTI